ncbi:MAG TPA: oligosaccharide flippase family protein [Solimonas sp.]|nr:oligosaccharide flippase family protein [Solimonas sp.]
MSGAALAMPTTGRGSLRGLARGAGLSLLTRVFAAAAELLLALCIARLLGADGAGMFFVALTAMTMASVLARLGLDNALLRLGAAQSAAGDWPRLRNTAQRALGAALLAAGLATLLLLAGSFGWSRLQPGSAELASAIGWMALAVAPVALASLYGELLKSVGRVMASQWIGAAGIPFLALLLVLGMGEGLGAHAAAVAYVAAALATALLGALAWHRALPATAATNATTPWSVLFKGTASLLWIKCARLAAGWLATGALALWVSVADAGIYSVALRISLALSLFLVSINTVAAPRFAVQASQGDRAGLARTTRLATLAAVLAGGPVLVLLLAAPAWVMSCFGADFGARGASVLVILALGQCVNLLTGPVGYLLLMSGNEQAMRRCTSYGLAAGVAGVLLLTPTMGAVGAAIGTAAAMAVQNLAAAWQARRLLAAGPLGRAEGRAS